MPISLAEIDDKRVTNTQAEVSPHIFIYIYGFRSLKTRLL